MSVVFPDPLQTLLSVPALNDAELAGLTWRSHDDRTTLALLGQTQRRAAAIIHAASDDAVVSSLIPQRDSDYQVLLVLRGTVELAGQELNPWGLGVVRPMDDTELLLHKGSVVLVLRTGQENTPMPGGNLSIPLGQLLRMPQLNESQIAPLNGHPGRIGARAVSGHISTGIYLYNRTKSPREFRAGRGGGFDLVISGAYHDGKRRNEAGACIVVGPREPIVASFPDDTVLLSVHIGDEE